MMLIVILVKNPQMMNYLAKTKHIVKNFMFRLIYNEHVKKTCKKNH